MTTTTMHFGPEWMRKAPSRANPSPPLATPAVTGASTYSALVAPVSQPSPEKPDLSHPFRYSKEDMIRIYKEGGGKVGLGLEVERWEGIVREVGSDPVSLREMSDAEKKIFAGPLNSEMRRRPSVDYLSLTTAGLGDRPKLPHTNTGPNSPLRERIGGFMGRRRDSTDQPPLSLPRKLSQSSLQPPLASPRDALPSPRTRMGSGFDGVLSDSWSSRRRASEGVVKVGGRPVEVGEDSAKTAKIKEEDEEHRDTPSDAIQSLHSSPNSNTDPPPADSAVATASGSTLQNGQSNMSGGLNNPSLGARALNMDGAGPAMPSTADGGPSGPPPGIVDPTTMEWTYLDPQGQVQGPFPALTMQKWYDDGYFAATLLMKRLQYDTEWTPVGELLQRAGNPRLFLTPLLPATISLPRRDPLLDGSVQDGSFGSPFQPVPTRSLRTSTLDSYLQNGPMVPDSPSSQFSVGRYSNESPDSTAFGGRIGPHMYNGPQVGPRLGFAGVQGNPLEAQRRATFDTTVEPLLSRQGYSSFSQGRVSTDGLGFGDTLNTSSTYLTSDASQASLTDKLDDFTNSRPLPSSQSSFAGNDFSSPFLGGREGPRLIKRDLYERSDPQLAVPSQFANGSVPFTSAGQSFSQGQSHPFPPPENRTLQSVQSTPERQPAMAHGPQQPFISPAHWPLQDTLPARRPGPFEADFPTSRNTIAHTAVNTVQAGPATVRTGQSAPVNTPSPWFTSPQTVAGEAWGPDPSSLTSDNLVQHNKQQEPRDQDNHERVVSNISPSPLDGNTTQPEPVSQPEATPEASAAVPALEAPATRSRRKAAAPATSAQQSNKLSAVTEAALPKPPSPVTVTAEQKSAWSIDEEKKPLSLREIQELEIKKLEARKAVERERERTARAAANGVSASPSVEDVTTLSWGLPTSQAGARAAKEPAALANPPVTPTTAAASTPVWTNAAKPTVVKKTMKEIQEEEEKRKKNAKDKETVAAAARRAYADSTNRTAATAAASVLQGGAWSTVGAGGKANAVIPPRPAISTAPSAKPPSQSVSSTSLSATPIAVRSPAATTPLRSPIVTAAMKLAPPAPKADEMPAPPSHELLKWMADSLKGLNNSVNLEEITSMLLSFPLDPDPSTMEIISELIYANSTTLDGRRFAAEFVSKRKAEAKGSPIPAAGGKLLSIADVVKTQPKPAQNEWGGFKVVNKKKKNARS